MELGEDYTIINNTLHDEMRHITAIPSRLVCSVQIDFDLDGDDKLHNVKYVRGCNGNLQAIGRLLEGMEAGKAAETLRGVDCNGRGTSCTDQLARIITKVSGKPTTTIHY